MPNVKSAQTPHFADLIQVDSVLYVTPESLTFHPLPTHHLLLQAPLLKHYPQHCPR